MSGGSSQGGNGQGQRSPLRSTWLPLLVGSAACTTIGIIKLAAEQPRASLVFLGFGMALAVAAKWFRNRETSRGA